MVRYAANQYQQVNTESMVQSATPHQLILMLMNGAIERINYAKGFMLRNAIAEKGTYISKALAIIAELQACLDLKVGGDLAENLFLLYDYMQRRLVEANLKNEPAYLDEVNKLLKEMKSGWEAMPEEIRRSPTNQIPS